MRILLFSLVALSLVATISGFSQVQNGTPGPVIPRTWDDAAMAAHEVPLAEAAASPKFPPAEYYYRIPVRPIYKSYPVYAPGHEPAGYLEWLKQQEPSIVWDDAGHAPPLKTDADWIRAGELVFDAPIFNDIDASVLEVRDPAWYKKTAALVTNAGILPIVRYVIRRKGVVEVGQVSCAMCHTRVMPDGSVIKGAQGNFSPQRLFACRIRRDVAKASDPDQYLAQLRAFEKGNFAAPASRPDPQMQRIDRMSIDEIASFLETFPPGIALRTRGGAFEPIQIPDLIGIQDRRYLDRSGLAQHRSIADLMRYAALNQGAERLGSYGGFIPADRTPFRESPDPDARATFRGLPEPDKAPLRYSDPQLYALALYLYSLQPPTNPNRFDALAARGQRVFTREGCAGCHAPPLYTNNKLTPADGFTVPEDHWRRYDILPVSVGTDSTLALKTRRGTGYYKVPSLKGLWYRGMFPHDGSCATLEDWFDPARLRDDYVPTGFAGYGIRSRAVPGHKFGLPLLPEDKRALIAFLKTL